MKIREKLLERYEMREIDKITRQEVDEIFRNNGLACIKINKSKTIFKNLNAVSTLSNEYSMGIFKISVWTYGENLVRLNAKIKTSIDLLFLCSSIIGFLLGIFPGIIILGIYMYFYYIAAPAKEDYLHLLIHNKLIRNKETVDSVIPLKTETTENNQKFCKYCGKKPSSISVYCEFCGKKI